MHLLSPLGSYSTHPPKLFLIVFFCPERPTNALLGTNLYCMVASPVGPCYSLPKNPDKLRLHVARHFPAVKSADIAAQEGT